MGNISSVLNKFFSRIWGTDNEGDQSFVWKAENIQTTRTISSGPIATVIEAVNLKNLQTCAVKTIEYEKHSDKIYEYAQKKAQILIELSNLKHPNIAKTYACETVETENSFDLKHKFAFMMEFYEMNLLSVLNERKLNQEFWEEADLLKYLLQTISALNEAYLIGVHHFSIKDENIFLSKREQRLILGDFDTFENSILNPNTRGQLYHPPEVSQMSTNLLNPDSKDGNSVDYSKSDLYSLGLIFWRMALLEELERVNAQRRIDQGLETLNSRGSQKLSQILKTMLARDPDQRPTLSQALKLVQDSLCEIKGVSFYNEELSQTYLEAKQKAIKGELDQGDMYRRAEDYKQGRIHYEKAKEMAIQENHLNHYDQYLLVLAYDGLSRCYLETKEYQSSMRFSMKGLKLRNLYLNGFGINPSLIAIGKVYQKLGDFQNALAYYMKASENMRRDKGDPLLLTKCAENLAYCYESLGDFETSSENYLEALATIQESFGMNNTKYINNLKSLARVYKSMGEQEKVKLIESELKNIRL